MAILGVTRGSDVKFAVCWNKRVCGHPLGPLCIEQAIHGFFDELQKSNMMHKLLYTEKNYMSSFVLVCVGAMRGEFTAGDVIHQQRARKFRMTSALVAKHVQHTDGNALLKHTYVDRVNLWDTTLTSIAAYIWSINKKRHNLSKLWLHVSWVFLSLMTSTNIIGLSKSQRECAAACVVQIACLMSSKCFVYIDRAMLMSNVQWLTGTFLPPGMVMHQLGELARRLHTGNSRPGSIIHRFARLNNIAVDTRALFRCCSN